MSEHRMALYDAFSDTAFGGSVAGIVADAGDLSAHQMQTIAGEIGAPATGFITGFSGNAVDARFFSTLTEYPMCGHGTLGLITWLMDTGELHWSGNDRLVISLRTSGGVAEVALHKQEDGRPCVMLSLEAPRFEAISVDMNELVALFAIAPDGISVESPIEVSASEFTHLMVPIDTLETMRAIAPNFSAIAEYSRRIGIDTISVFTRETVHPESAVHCREFCPAVGTPESPATGTTNRALACYLVRHRLVERQSEQPLVVLAEQGYEMGRPSRIRSELMLEGQTVTGVRVGGVATRTLEGTLCAGPASDPMGGELMFTPRPEVDRDQRPALRVRAQ